jgi:8-oxo-dGTP pyrophosphatase MutT (NUDIX family)
MADETTRPGHVADRQESFVKVAVVVAWVVAGVGVIDGIVLVARRRETPCADGTFFPEGTTDYNCYVHPQAGLGVAVVVFSIVLAILVWLAGISAISGRRSASVQGGQQAGQDVRGGEDQPG